jgi:hypothetical protein
VADGPPRQSRPRRQPVEGSETPCAVRAAGRATPASPTAVAAGDVAAVEAPSPQAADGPAQP